LTQQAFIAQQQPVPPNVAQVAAANSLGALRKIYVPKRHHRFGIVLTLLVGVATLIAVVGFWILWVAFRTPNLSRSQAARRLYLYEQGFVLADRPDDPQAFRWDGIDTVFQKIVIRRTYGVETNRIYLYTITRRDGRVAKLTQFWSDIAELGPGINESVSAALAPRMLAAVERGQSVQFGDMTVNAVGIAGRRRSVTWSEVTNVRIRNGYVSVDVAGKFFALSTVAAAKLPNLPLFLALAGHLRRGTAR
jgi:hypothetical protein